MKKPVWKVLLPRRLPWEAGPADGTWLLKAVVLSCLVTCGHEKLQQPLVSLSKATDESAQISCKVSINNFKSVTIHWYRQKRKKGLEFLLYVLATPTHILKDEKHKKMEASKNFSASTSTLTIYSLEKEDEAVYFCSYG